MSQHECQRCGERKTVDEMIVRGGKPSKTCRACFAASCSGNGRSGRGASKREPAPAATDDGLVNGPALSIAPGLGVEAWIENGCLQLSQGDDVVALSKTEAKCLFSQFQEWTA